MNKVESELKVDTGRLRIWQGKSRTRTPTVGEQEKRKKGRREELRAREMVRGKWDGS